MYNPGRDEEYEHAEEYGQYGQQEVIRTILQDISSSIPLHGLDDRGFLRKPQADAGDEAEDDAEDDFGRFHVVRQSRSGAGTFFADRALGFSMVRIAAVHDLLGALVGILFVAGQSPSDCLPSLRSLVKRGFVDTVQPPGDGFPGFGALVERGRLGFLEHFTERLTHFDSPLPHLL